VHNADIVPHLAPSYFPFDYWHVATEIYQDKHGDYKECNGSGEDPTCADSHLIYSVTDHLRYMDQCMGDLCGNCRQSDDQPLQ